MARPNASKNKNIEYEYYSNILGEYNWKYIKSSRQLKNSSFYKIQRYKIIAGLSSTLIYAAISRGIKTIIFARGHGYNLGFPLKLKKNGPFWISEYNEKKLTKIMENIDVSSLKNWNKINSKYKNLFITYNYKNSIIFNKLKQFPEIRKQLKN